MRIGTTSLTTANPWLQQDLASYWATSATRPAEIDWPAMPGTIEDGKVALLAEMACIAVVGVAALSDSRTVPAHEITWIHNIGTLETLAYLISAKYLISLFAVM